MKQFHPVVFHLMELISAPHQQIIQLVYGMSEQIDVYSNLGNGNLGNGKLVIST